MSAVCIFSMFYMNVMRNHTFNDDYLNQYSEQAFKMKIIGITIVGSFNSYCTWNDQNVKWIAYFC